ncbi:MAG: TOBE domain-containing protein, partial [Chloroflexi bacterium]|nr:TOBE domain-containing protein [Chloroflexota bacterium]
LDEPFSNLDTDRRREMRIEVEQILRTSNIATVFVTHDRDEAFAMADRVGVMRNGKLEQIDTPDNIYRTPISTFVARFCRTCDFLKGRARDGIVETEIGDLPFSSGAGAIKEGSEVSLMVQPDDFRVIKDPNGGSVIESREFRGGETMLVVRMPSGAKLNCRQLSPSDIVPGDRVTLVPASDTPMTAFQTDGDD